MISLALCSETHKFFQSQEMIHRPCLEKTASSSKCSAQIQMLQRNNLPLQLQQSLHLLPQMQMPKLKQQLPLTQLLLKTSQSVMPEQVSVEPRISWLKLWPMVNLNFSQMLKYRHSSIVWHKGRVRPKAKRKPTHWVKHKVKHKVSLRLSYRVKLW